MKRAHLSVFAVGVWTAGVIYAVFAVVPPAEGLGDLVKIAFFHIPVAWVSVLAFLLSAGSALQYLRTGSPEYDRYSSVSAGLGLAFCIMATVSGAIFAKLTWGAYWNWDPRQTSIFVLLLIYGAYQALRSAIVNQDQKARISAVYSLLSFITVPFLVFIIPRYYFSLHPAPLINSSASIDMDGIMLQVLGAALIACTAIFWVAFTRQVRARRRKEELFATELRGDVCQ